MAVSRSHNPLGTSFMALCFITAALLIWVQSRGNASRTWQSAKLQPTAQPTQTASVPQAAVDTAIPSVQPGLAEILNSSFHPVALVNEPKIVIRLSRRTLSFYQNNVLTAEYGIAVGREGWETPTGEFRVLNMRENPLWQNPITGETFLQGEANPLGSRWIGFWTDGKHQIGLHGTNQDDLIGQAVSHGCIRMRDAEIQVLFNQVAIGTPVVVEP
jgi:L,D-transpeptidase catalytic domain